MGVKDTPREIGHEHFVMRFSPKKAPQIPIDVERIKTHLVLAVSVATSGTASHFVGLLVICP